MPVRDAPVIAAPTAVVAAHGRWGFWKCYHRLRLDGRRWNHKRVHRVYRALRLNLPRRTKRRVPQRLRQPLEAPAVLNQTWALDYMTDAFYDGQRFRALTLLDEGNREALAIEIATSIPSPRVVRLLDELVALHGRPCALRVDNGPGSSRPNRWSTGVPRRASRCTTSSRASPIRTPTSSGSTVAVVTRYSMPMPSNR